MREAVYQSIWLSIAIGVLCIIIGLAVWHMDYLYNLEGVTPVFIVFLALTIALAILTLALCFSLINRLRVVVVTDD